MEAFLIPVEHIVSYIMGEQYS